MRCRTAPGTDMVRTALNGIGRVSPVVLPSAMTLIGAFLLSTAASAQTAAIATNKGTGMEKVDSQAAPPPIGLTGDWGGLRTDLHDAASYVSETAGNYQGGSRQITRETGQFALGFTADMAALAGLDGGTMQFT